MGVFGVFGVFGESGSSFSAEESLSPTQLSATVASPLGWLSKLGSLFGYPKCQVPYYNKDPKRGHNFDNHPLGGSYESLATVKGLLKGSYKGSLNDGWMERI